MADIHSYFVLKNNHIFNGSNLLRNYIKQGVKERSCFTNQRFLSLFGVKNLIVILVSGDIFEIYIYFFNIQTPKISKYLTVWVGERGWVRVS